MLPAEKELADRLLVYCWWATSFGSSCTPLRTVWVNQRNVQYVLMGLEKMDEEELCSLEFGK